LESDGEEQNFKNKTKKTKNKSRPSRISALMRISAVHKTKAPFLAVEFLFSESNHSKCKEK
jgi:hypothetical protein